MGIICVGKKDYKMAKGELPFDRGEIPHIIRIMLLYIENNAKSLKASGMSFTQDKRIKMLSDIKKFCSPKEQETIDTLVNILSVMGNYDSLA